MVVIHPIKGFSIVNKAEVDVFLELFFFFFDSIDVGNLTSVSPACSKTSLNIWKFLIYILLKPGLKNLDHYFASVWDECNCVVLTEHSSLINWTKNWTFFGIVFGIGMRTNLFQSRGHCWVFQICWQIECSTLTASSFRIWNSSAGIPSPPLALFILMHPKAHLVFVHKVFILFLKYLMPTYLSNTITLKIFVCACVCVFTFNYIFNAEPVSK